MATLVWFRLDLRLADNPVLAAARERGKAIVPVFIWDPEEQKPWEPGGASRWWLHHSLHALDADLRERGSRLILRIGSPEVELPKLAHECQADAVYWGRRYEPAAIARDSALKTALKDEGFETESFNDALLFEPWEVKTKTGGPFQVYTPFWRATSALADDKLPPTVGSEAGGIKAPHHWPASEKLDQLNLLPKIDWAAGMRQAWKPGEIGAQEQLEFFLKSAIDDYKVKRDEPGITGTSRLSPHLHFGEISPRAIWHAVHERLGRARKRRADQPGSEVYLKELVWREFAYHLLFHFPHTPTEPLRADFKAFPWQDPKTSANRKALRAWQRGRTGYPLVDAGMRQLWTTGWMHNRVRMVTASFLVKHLMLPWQEGARWFWDTLVDADLASNTLGWQWTAGCGADAAPYFRVFNPTSQAERFDEAGDYVRHWVPELAKLPVPWIHRPWDAPESVLAAAGVKLDETYPRPLVEHTFARDRALAAFAGLKKG